MRSSWRSLATLTIACLLPLSLAHAEQPRGIGVVTALQGQATVSRLARPDPGPLRFKEDVFLRDVITTKERSTVRLLLGGKGVLTIREQSQVTLAEEGGPGARQSVLNLVSGKVGAAIAKSLMGPGESFEIRSPNAVAAVRGTVVIAEYIPAKQTVQARPILLASADPAPLLAQAGSGSGQSNFFVLSGSVTIAVQGQPPVTLGAMQSVSISSTSGGMQIGAVQNMTPAQAAAAAQGLQAGRPATGDPSGGRTAAAQAQMAAALATLLLNSAGDNAVLAPPPPPAPPSSQAPILPLQSPKPPPPTITLAPVAGDHVVRGTGVPGGTVEVFVNGSPAATTAVHTDGTWEASVPILSAGDSVTARQLVGNGPSVLSSAVPVGPGPVVPTPPPAPTITTSPVAGDMVLRGTGVPGATVEVFVNGSPVGTAVVATDGTWTLTVSPLTAGGSVTARQRGPGGTSPLSTAVAVAPPVVPPIVEPPPVDNTIPAGVLVRVDHAAVGVAAGVPLLTFTDGQAIGSQTAIGSPTGSVVIAQVPTSGPVIVSLTDSLIVQGKHIFHEGSLLSLTHGAAVASDAAYPTAPVVRVDGTRLTNLGGPLVNLSDGSSILDFGSLFEVRGGGTLAATGIGLNIESSDSENPTSVSLAGPVFGLRGGSTLASKNQQDVSSPLTLSRMRGGVLSAGSLWDSDHTGNRLNIYGQLIDAEDAEIYFSGSNRFEAGMGATDVFRIDAPADTAQVRLVNTIYTDWAARPLLRFPDRIGTEPYSTYGGLLLDASGNRTTIKLAGPLLHIRPQDSVHATATDALIRLSGIGRLEAGVETGLDAILLEGGALKLVGPLVSATGSMSQWCGEQRCGTLDVSGSFLRMKDGARLSGSSDAPLITLGLPEQGGYSTLFAGGPFAKIEGTGTTLELQGALLKLAGQAEWAQYSVLNAPKVLEVTDGASVIGHGTAPFIEVHNSTVNTTSDVIRVQQGSTVRVNGSLLESGTGPQSQIVAGGGLLKVQSGGSVLETGDLGFSPEKPLLAIQSRSVETNSDLISVSGEGSKIEINRSLLSVSRADEPDAPNANVTIGGMSGEWFVPKSVLKIDDGASVTVTGGQPVINLSNAWVTAKNVLEMTGGSLTIGGPLLEMAGTTLTLAEGESFIRMQGSTLTMTNSANPLLDPSAWGGWVDSPGLIATGIGDGPNSQLDLAGPLLNLGGTNGTTLFVPEGASADAFVQLDHTDVIQNGNLIDASGGGSIRTDRPLLNASNSTFDVAGGLFTIGYANPGIGFGDEYFKSTSSDPLINFTDVTYTGGWSLGGDFSPGASLVYIRGTNTFSEEEVGEDEAYKVGTGKDKVLETRGVLFKAKNSTITLGPKQENPETPTLGAAPAVKVDTALMNASAPFVKLVKSTLNHNSTAPIIELAKSNVSFDSGEGSYWDQGAMRVYRGSVTSYGPVLGLNKSILRVENGPLLSVTGGAHMTIKNNDLLMLMGGSRITIANGTLVTVTGSGSSLTVDGALINFRDTGNTIIVNNSLSYTTINGVRVHTDTPANVTIQGTPIQGQSGNTLTVTGPDGLGALVKVTNNGALTVRGAEINRTQR